MMKYFTKDRYGKLQIKGFLYRLPETEEDWKYDLDYFFKEGLEYKSMCKNRLESYRDELLVYLPEPFHPYINNETINYGYHADLRNMILEWVKEWKDGQEKIKKDYNKHYN